MISINREAMKTVRVILEEADALGVEVDRLDNGATVVDMGLRAKGGWRAGRLYTLVTIGGLGEVSYEPFAVAGRMLSAVRVMIDHPVEGCVASQIAGWRLEAPGKEHAAILAGPGRALNRESLDHYFDWVDYRDDHHEAVVAIQASEPVTAELADMIATSCRVEPDDLYVLLAPQPRPKDLRAESTLPSIQRAVVAAAGKPPDAPRRLVKLASWREPDLLAVSEPLHPDVLQIAMAHRLPRASRQTCSPRRDQPVLETLPQVVGHHRGGGVPPVGVLFQRLERDFSVGTTSSERRCAGLRRNSTSPARCSVMTMPRKPHTLARNCPHSGR